VQHVAPIRTHHNNVEWEKYYVQTHVYMIVHARLQHDQIASQHWQLRSTQACQGLFIEHLKSEERVAGTECSLLHALAVSCGNTVRMQFSSLAQVQ
jgi:predicted thioesterase